MTVSSLYPAEVIHVRHEPVVHRLRYRALYLLIDLEEAQSLAERCRFFSYNRFNLISWHERDHGDGSARPLRYQIEAHLRGVGIETEGGPIRILCMPRVLGLVFNPLSIFFCYGRDGRLAATLYEVNNTFGQRHSYLISAAGHSGVMRHHCAKSFYVSPFMPMALAYRFRLAEPGERLAVHITAEDSTGRRVLTAVLGGKREGLTDGLLMRAFLRSPLLAWHVLGAIHWEALKLWRKGLRIEPRPQPPADPVTFGRDLSR
ncbi:MAG: DUF1365 domain-containing protein [Acidobacteriota bacterium]